MEMKSVYAIVRTGWLSGAALLALSGAATAADMSGSSKDGPVEEAPPPTHTITVNGGLTTDYVFRGISQSDEGPAAFVGADLAYRWFYAGVWASSVDDVTSDGGVEIDVYAGIKKSWNGVDLDVGVLYYAYPNNDADVTLDYVEIKGALSGKIWRDITLTGTVFYSPDYYAETGETWTLEGKAVAPLPVGGLTLSGVLGTVIGNDDEFEDFNGFDQYTYWNVGLSKTFREHFTVDVRYWGTDIDTGFTTDDLADDRIVGTISFNY
jgi:uncharacterized protein (TIGR02001 family)